MHTGKGRVNEVILQDGIRHARLVCAENLIPSPGQYLLTSAAPDSPLPDPVFHTECSDGGFIAAPAADSWTPGTGLHLRGPLGRGFQLPAAARKVALVAFEYGISQLRGLIQPALRQGAAVVLVADAPADNLPDEIELQPISNLPEIAQWADWIAFVINRENLSGLGNLRGRHIQASVLDGAEILIRTPVPCGGIADCGACAIVTGSGWSRACKDGPVFRWKEI